VGFQITFEIEIQKNSVFCFVGFHVFCFSSFHMFLCKFL
jgi:hypothetical protein